MTKSARLLLLILMFFLVNSCYKSEANKRHKIAVVAPKSGYEVLLTEIEDVFKSNANNVDLVIENFAVTKEDFSSATTIVNSLDVDLVVTISTPATVAFYENIKDKPIIFAGVGDPVVINLADSLKKPKKNITGVTDLSIQLTKKRVELFKLAFPQINRLLTFYNPENIYSILALKDMLEICEKLKIKLEAIECFDTEDFRAKLKKINKRSNDGIFIIPEPVVLSAFDSVVSFSKKFFMPICVYDEDYIEKGATFSYGVDLKDVAKNVLIIIENVLKGIAPEKLPIYVPENINLVVNNRAAKEYGYKIPNEILYLADKVVE